MKRKENEAKARFIMIGGFLGAGKTTAVAALAQQLAGQGVRVGLITNDQSIGLVDTKMLRSQGFSVEEIAGGCFCCRFNSLLDASAILTEKTRPDIFLAEPVGSCTDLVATVSYPLRRIYGNHWTISPLSVLVDPKRAARILGLEAGKPFSEKVVYIYKKQLEEADIIVVNKCDSIAPTLRGRLVAALKESYPQATVFCCSAQKGTDLAPWFEKILAEEADPAKAMMALDYDIYAEGEALLGWLNCTVAIRSETAFDANSWLLDLARSLRNSLRGTDTEIAHLKMTFDAGDPSGNLAAVSLVRGDGEPELRESLVDELTGGDLIINLRAEADPEHLRRIVSETLQTIEESPSNYQVNLEH
ncbi:MAG: cobalamin biosynthesis protein P47K, partial [Candidatus Hydrogenedentes bacterium]|nr:cobalamin biosynthesis protein P47K [Candidatus Hydrogenedentota bacterium]